MNTEAMNTLRQVRATIKIVQLQLADVSLQKNERDLLEIALQNLNDMDDIIVNNVLQEMIDKINVANDQLKDLIVKMKASTDKIARFSNAIKTISDTVGVLTTIMSQAMKAGILGL